MLLLHEKGYIILILLILGVMLEKATRLIASLRFVGYDGDIIPDDIDQMYSHRSTALILESLEQWLIQCPDAEMLRRYNKIEQMGFGRLPDPKDEAELLAAIEEEEKTVKLYEDACDEAERSSASLQCKLDSLNTLDTTIKVPSMIKDVENIKKLLIADDSCVEFSFQEIFLKIKSLVDRLLSEIAAILDFIEADIAVDETSGALFDLVPEEMMMLQNPTVSEGFRKFIPENVCHDQDWIDSFRHNLHSQIMQAILKHLLETLAVLQILYLSLNAIKQSFDDKLTLVYRVHESMLELFHKEDELHSLDPFPSLHPITDSPELKLSDTVYEMMSLLRSIRPCLERGELIPDDVAVLKVELKKLINSIAYHVKDIERLTPMTKA